jgi:3-phenylpropionate/trans-cinnamate dioxygenase ferredoxin reductase subunit
VCYLRTAADAERIRALLRPGASVAVVGAGFIGLEVASSARTVGCEVTVLEADDAILSRVLPRELGEDIAAAHRERTSGTMFGEETFDRGPIRSSYPGIEAPQLGRLRSKWRL